MKNLYVMIEIVELRELIDNNEQVRKCIEKYGNKQGIDMWSFMGMMK